LSGIPIFIHFLNSSTVSLSNGFSGGISPDSTYSNRGLSSGLPGTTLGPPSPPLRIASLVSNAKPPFTSLAFEEWHE
jgi:hypothetical protein